MSVRLLLTASLAALLLSGCRHDPRTQLYIDNVNAEKRLLEDTLYDLQYDYECSMQEVERLREEVAQLKSSPTAGGASSPASGAGRRSSAPSTPGDTMFPDFPDLKPPTVESGTPTEPKPPASGTSRPAGQPDDLDDLEPPVLDLGEQTSRSPAAPRLLDKSAIEGADAPETPADKPVSRWTPRAPRPPDTPPQSRIHVADRRSAPPAAGSVTDDVPNASAADRSGTGASSKPSQRPQWRPYR